MNPLRFQPDPLLRLLAHAYSHLSRRDRECASAYIRLRTLCSAAPDLPAFAASLQAWVKQAEAMAAPELAVCAETLALLDEMLSSPEAGAVLIVGQTDGYRHLCPACSQEKANFGRVRFFQIEQRRPLLKPEVSGRHRSPLSRCQICSQSLAPSRAVLLVPAGTSRHLKGCACGTCTRAGVVAELSIYACEGYDCRTVLPRLLVVKAPSYARCLELAWQRCWREGWYVMNASPLEDEGAV